MELTRDLPNVTPPSRHEGHEEGSSVNNAAELVKNDAGDMSSTDTDKTPIDSEGSIHRAEIHIEKCRSASSKPTAEVCNTGGHSTNDCNGAMEQSDNARQNIAYTSGQIEKVCMHQRQQLCIKNSDAMSQKFKNSESIEVPKRVLIVTPPCKPFPFSTSYDRKCSFHFDTKLGKYEVGQRSQTLPRNMKQGTKTVFPVQNVNSFEDLVWL